jgi:hypothetical protein
MNDFLKEEAIGKDKAAMFQVTAKAVSEGGQLWDL